MCQVWFHALSVKSDQGSQRRPKEIAVYVNFSIPPSLVITQVKKNLKTTFSSISPYSHNISFSPSSLHFHPDFSLLTFSGHFSLLPTFMYFIFITFIRTGVTVSLYVGDHKGISDWIMETALEVIIFLSSSIFATWYLFLEFDTLLINRESLGLRHWLFFLCQWI